MFLSRKAGDSTDSAYLSRLTRHFFSVLDAADPDKARERRNWRVYSGVNGGQWDPEAYAYLRSEGRPTHQLNVVQGAIDWISGILHQNKSVTVFTPRTTQNPEQVNLAQHLFEYEYDRGHWRNEEFKLTRDGLIFRGICKYYIDYCNSQLGNLGWETIAPWNVTPDPAWATEDVKKLRFVYQDDFYDPDYIMDHWKNKDGALRMAAEQMENEQSAYDVQTRLGSRWGQCYQNGKYRVIELHFMEDEEEAEVWDFEKGETKKTLPQTAQEILLTSDPKRFKKIVRTTRKEKVVVWCPAFGSSGIILSEGNYALQLGRLSYDFFSAKNLYGEVQGQVDVMVDGQEIANKRQSMLTVWESQTSNAATIADKTFFPDPAMQRKLEVDGNKPGTVHWADGGNRDLRGAVVPMPTGAPPTYLAQGAADMVNLIEHIAHVDIAMRPGAGSDKATGANLDELLAASHVPFEPLNLAIQTTFVTRAEAFIPAAKYIYSAAPRKIKGPTQSAAIIINRPTEYGVENPIEDLERYDFSVKLSELGQDKKLRDKKELMQQLQITQNPMLRSRIELEMTKFYEYPADVRQRMEEDALLFIDLQKKQTSAQIEQIDAQKKQTEMNQQMQQQQMQNPGMPPGQPAPPPGGPKEAARSAGMGTPPSGAAIAGQQAASNNVQASAPSDLG